MYIKELGLSWLLGGNESICNARATGDSGSIPGLGRSSGEGNDNPLQYSCLENPMNRGAWWATVHRAADDTNEQLCKSQAIPLRKSCI